MCQDDYVNVDYSRWRFEKACDQHSADKVLHNHGEYSLNECLEMKQNVLHTVQDTDFSFVPDVQEFLNCSLCPCIINIILMETLCREGKKACAVWLFALSNLHGKLKIKCDLIQLKSTE